MKYLASCSHNKLCCSWVHHVCQKHHKCRTFFFFFLSLCVLLHQESSGIASPCVFSSSYVRNHYLRKIMSLIWIMALIWCIMLPLILFLANPPTCILHAWLGTPVDPMHWSLTQSHEGFMLLSANLKSYWLEERWERQVSPQVSFV